MTLCRWVIGSGYYEITDWLSCSLVEISKMNTLQNTLFLCGKLIFSSLSLSLSPSLWILTSACSVWDGLLHGWESVWYKVCHSRWQSDENVIQQWQLILKFLFCGIHDDNFSITDYVVSMVGWRVNNESERIWKEAVIDWPRLHPFNYLKYSGIPS